MFQQKRETINTYEGAHLLVKLRAVGRWYISIFHRISVVNKNEKITFSGITHNAKMFTRSIPWKKLFLKISPYS